MTGPAGHFSTHWYDVVADQSLRQGDLLRDLLVFWLPQDLPYRAGGPKDGEIVNLQAEFARGDWIVMDASCDVDQNPNWQVLLARVLPVSREMLGENSDKSLATRLEVLRKNLEPTKFLLAECPTIAPPFPRSFVQWRVRGLVPIQYLKRSCIGERLRLKHPHRERFGAWAGANLSRIGPEDDTLIPPPEKKTSTYPTDILRANEAP